MGYPWSAALIGFLGGFVYFGSSKCVLNLCKVDDPLGAFAVHGACGFWGVFSTALFMAEDFDYRVTDVPSNSKKGGLFMTGNGMPLAAAMAQLTCIIAWVGSLSAIMFFTLKTVGIL